MPPIANYNQALNAKDNEFNMLFNELYQEAEEAFNNGTIDLGAHIEPNALAKYYNNLDIFNTFLYCALKSYMKHHNEKTKFFFNDVDFFLSKNNPMKITQVFMQRPGIGEVAVQRALSFHYARDFFDLILWEADQCKIPLAAHQLSRHHLFSLITKQERDEFYALFPETCKHYHDSTQLKDYKEYDSIAKWYRSTTAYARIRKEVSRMFKKSLEYHLSSEIGSLSKGPILKKMDTEGKHIKLDDVLYDAETLLSKFQYIEYDNTSPTHTRRLQLFPSKDVFDCYLDKSKKHLWDPFISPDAAIHLVLEIESANLSERCIRATEEVRKSSFKKRISDETLYWRTETGDFRNLGKLDIRIRGRDMI